MKQMISASRRTDIPQFYAEWFEKRVQEGVVEFRNTFGGRGQASLKPEAVAGFLFWTKYAKPLSRLLSTLRSENRPYAFQYTITGMGGSSMEPNTPQPEKAIENFLTIRQDLPGSQAIQWRYDPIVLTDEWNASYHIKKFEEIAKALQGATRVVNVSFVEPYLKSLRRLKAYPSLRFRPIDPDRHRSAVTFQDRVCQVDLERGKPFLQELFSIASSHGMALRACCNPEFGFPASQCISHELFSEYKEKIGEHIAQRPSRSGCQCLRAVDIGMDNSCMGGCPYCYVVVSHKTAEKNFNQHNPEATSLRPTTRLEPQPFNALSSDPDIPEY